jgi:sulfur-carrier protein
VAEVIVRYWAAAKEAAGLAEERVSANTVGDVIDAIRSCRAEDARFSDVLKRSSFLIDGNPVAEHADDTAPLVDGTVIEVLPAFVGN